jgi:regulator of protease activity HflC (stomatin/prohibitin superfamily)
MLIFLILVALFVLTVIIKGAVIVPQKTAYIIERLGKYRCTLDAGFHVLIPFLDRIAYRHTLKEQAIDVPPQQCITKDNIAVDVDGILYMQVMDPAKASYGISNYRFATTQLAQTTMRSEMGKLDLDRSFEERTNINAAVVTAVDKASDPWGIKVTRYEIKNITPPQSIRDAMEKQMRAEREKRAMIAESEGERQSKINRAEGERQQAIALSEGERMRRINEAEGKAKEIMLDVVSSHPQVITDGSKSGPSFRFSSMESSAIRLRVSYILTDHELSYTVPCQIRELIYKRFRAEGIKVPHNIIDVHVEE